jgi:very-short-patch-repair endonuclease/DNA-binding NarL/FixJ family response regulator
VCNFKYGRQFYIDNILPLVKDGHSTTIIFNTLKIHEATVRKCVYNYGSNEEIELFKTNNKKAKALGNIRAQPGRNKAIKKRDTKYLNLIIESVKEGYDYYQISKKINVYPKTVIRIVNRYNDINLINDLEFNLQKNKKTNNILKGKKISKTRLCYFNSIFDEVVPMIEAGLTSKQIGEKYNRYHGSITSLVRRCGTYDLYSKLLFNNIRRRKEVCISNNTNFGRTKTSKCEKMLYGVVRSHYPEAVPNLPIKRRDGFYWYIDIAIPSLMLAIEYDGSYWHQDEQKDRKRDESLLQLGWTTLRFKYSYTPTTEKLDVAFKERIKQYLSNKYLNAQI